MMEFLDDPFADPVIVKGPTTGRFQPKAAKARPKKGPSGLDHSEIAETPTPDVSFAFHVSDFQIDIDPLEAAELSCLDTTDIVNEAASSIEKKAVKFKPKPKAQNQHTIHAVEPDIVSDVLHMGVDGNLSLDPSMYQPDSDSLMPENLRQQSEENRGERNAYDALGSSAKSGEEGFFSGLQGNENGCELLDGISGGFNANSCAPDELASNRDENNDGDLLGEDTSQKKRPHKSKKVAAENDKPPRKRKKAAQELDVSTEKPPKKFPRATRRKRCVDKALLEAPEDELDLQRVPIRDLIILAEYKERQAKKEAAASLPTTTERNDNVSPEDLPYDDNETFGFDQDGDTFDNPSTSGVQKDTGYFNYHSFMTKEPRMRWTKQDTELFYQGLSQFGSDLSMVQQLFPGRTRHQIKLKYKKEERQNPMRLHDALTSRAQDLSHFELVIQRLQEQAARDAKIDNDDSVCVIGEEEGPEEVLNTHQEDVANSKQNEEGQAVDQEPEKCQVENPPKSYHSEEEDFDWSSYQSVL